MKTEKHITTKQLTVTAIMLALCIVFQSLKFLSPYITGSAVNAVLIITTLYCGVYSGSIIAIFTPVFAFLLGQTPILKIVPLMIFVIMIGNLCLVLITHILKKNLYFALILASIVKSLFLWLVVWYLVIPFFAFNIPEKMQLAIKTSFSLLQLITALIGSAIAVIIWQRVKHLKTNKT